ncbi:MAG: DUF4276 family protein [Symbiobacteriia bacterium]
MKFVLLVEGDAEYKALPALLKRWLDPRLRLPVGIRPVNMVGLSEYLKEGPKRTRLYLDGPDGSDIVGVIGLLDLYGPTIYPAHLQAADERCKWLTQQMEAEVGRAKFRHFCAVHELEAWLLSDPTLFPMEIQKALPPSVAHPETVDFDRPPARLLAQLYREKLHSDYKKVTHGVTLFQRLDPARPYATCPNFKSMLDEMLVLARAAGL